MGEIERRNVIVVGAGASKEFGLPTGAELLEKIQNLADLGFNNYGQQFFGDHSVYQAFVALAKKGPDYDGTANTYLHQSWLIRDNMPLAPSIDNFLHTHRETSELVEVGKILIAKAILDAERASTLFIDSQIAPQKIDFSRGYGDIVSPPSWSWLGELFRLLVAERGYKEFISAIKNITFISFNYDRCIAQFLIHAASDYFSCDNSQKEEILASLKIIHPYGSLGELTIPSYGTNGFGDEVSGEQLAEISLKIRTFTEGLVSSELSDEIGEAFSMSELAIFLGFGFLPLNMRLLFEARKFQINRVIGTSKGISEESVGIIREELFSALITGSDKLSSLRKSLSHDRVELSDLTCQKLFLKHHRYLQQR